MEFFAYTRAKLGDDAFDAEICRQCGIRPETSSRWKSVDGFEEWLEARIAFYRADIHKVLEQVAIKNLDDFRFWEALAKKYGFIDAKGDEPFKLPPGLNLSTDQVLDIVERVKARKQA